jgi:perosamine synthetase
MRVPLFRPAIREEAVEAAARVLRSGWIGSGPVAEAFEHAFAEYVGAPCCVAVSSCTAALQLALRVLDLPEGAEVITSPVTFVSAAQVIVQERLRPVFADVDPETGNLDVESVRARLTSRTGAVIPLHYGGRPCDLDELYEAAGDAGVAVVEDCAHAAGAAYKGQRIGTHGSLHAFSFNAVKNLPAPGGGALTLGSEEYEARLRPLRVLGLSSDTFTRARGGTYTWEYDVRELGLRATMSDVEAAVALAQLEYLDADNARRAEIVARYRRELASVPGLRLLREVEPDRTSSNHLLCVLAEERDRLVERLREAGVDSSVHYRRNDTYELFEEQDLPGAERFSSRVISLPLFVGLTDEQVDYVVEIVRGGW